MLEIIPFCVLVGILIGAVAVLDIVAIKKAKKVSLERPEEE